MRSLHSADLLLWSEQQAAAARRAGEHNRDADWDRIARLIENVGRDAIFSAEAALRAILAQAILGYSEPGSLARRQRNDRLLAAVAALRSEVSHTLRQRLDLESLWRGAFDDAVAELDRERRTQEAGGAFDPHADGGLPIPPGLPRDCPFTLDELLSEDFTYDKAVEQLYIRLTSWRPRPRKDMTT